MIRKTLTASLLALAVAAPFAQAYEAGDIVLRAGAITVDPQEDSSNVKLNGAAITSASKATLDTDTQLGLNFVYMLNSNVGVELLAATPFQHSVGLKGLGGLDGNFADVKHLPPTLSVVYYPFDTKEAFRPYVGLGINYTTFFSEDINSAYKPAFSNLELDDSWGIAAQVGADFMLTDNVMINAQLRWIDIDTEATADLAGAGKVKVDVDIDPLVYMVGLGYKF